MPRPKPFPDLVYTSTLDEQQILTPRTPHSQFDRQAIAENQYDDIDIRPTHREPQTVPLLSAEEEDTGNSNNSTHHAAGRSKGTSKIERLRSATRFIDIPLILGALAACLLFGLLVFSYKNPGRLQKYAGVKDLGPEPSPGTDEVVTPPPPEIPLYPSEYVAQCRKVNSGFMSHGDYWDEPSMDMKIESDTLEDGGDVVDDKYTLPEGGRTAVCSKTITYLLDGEVGLLADLALIAQAAALARERNRTFFIDDTYWNRGRWNDYFQSHTGLEPGPEPFCRAPHPKDLVACPRTTRHWVITAHTAKYHFGHPFSDHYEDPYARNLNRLRPVYEAARKSYVSTIRPNGELGALIRSTRHELLQSIPSTTTSKSPDTYISTHVRRGDRKHRFAKTPYTSIPEYIEAAKNTRKRLSHFLSDSPMYFASDSPDAESEFAKTYDGRLFSLRRSQDPALRDLASTEEYNQKEFNSLSLEDRSRLTKGMIVDFALLAGMWSWEGDPIPRAGICTISSNVCRMMAVGLGWDGAFGKVDDTGSIDENLKGWVELEDKGIILPVWTAFELFK